MRVTASIITGFAVAGLATGLGAQQPKAQSQGKAPDADHERCIMVNGRSECRWFGEADSVMRNRAVIGVSLSPTGTARDTLGVFVSRVTPKGPAENAGIVEGDRIVSINGVDLRVNSADAGDSYAADLPSRRLSREVNNLKPGSVISLRVNSGGRIRDVQVTAGRASDFRESGALLGLLDGARAGGVFRSMPDFESMRVPLERLRTEMPKIRMQEFDLPRRLEGLSAPRVRIESMPRIRTEGMPRVWVDGMPGIRVQTMPGLRDGEGRIRIYTPRKDGEYRTYIITPDGELKLDNSDKSKQEREKIEKSKK